MQTPFFVAASADTENDLKSNVIFRFYATRSTHSVVVKPEGDFVSYLFELANDFLLAIH